MNGPTKDKTLWNTFICLTLIFQKINNGCQAVSQSVSLTTYLQKPSFRWTTPHGVRTSMTKLDFGCFEIWFKYTISYFKSLNNLWTCYLWLLVVVGHYHSWFNEFNVFSFFDLENHVIELIVAVNIYLHDICSTCFI